MDLLGSLGSPLAEKEHLRESVYHLVSQIAAACKTFSPDPFCAHECAQSSSKSLYR